MMYEKMNCEDIYVLCNNSLQRNFLIIVIGLFKISRTYLSIITPIYNTIILNIICDQNITQYENDPIFLM